ncbi:hypothetical protein C0995_009089 [Termitomyces sp. Mi166|nr:hypothetical protein C0995_009089 [Termitomyces sp. Mi166\
MLSKAFFALAILASCAVAQSSTASNSAAEPSTSLPAGLTPCILGCIQPAAQAAGCAFTDPTCVCTSTEFQQQAAQCLQQQCTAEEVQTALGLQAQECGAVGAIPSGSATTEANVSAPVTTGAGQSSSTKPTSTAPASHSSGAATSSASAPVQTTNAAMGRGDGMGIMSLIVAGVFGLAL